MKKLRKRDVLTAIRYLLIAIVTAAFVSPIFWMFLTSLKTRVDMFATPPKWIFEPTLRNYVSVFRRMRYGEWGVVPALTHFERFLLNSIIISAGSVAVVITIGTLAAYSFSRFNIPGKDTWLFFILSTRMLPPITVLIPIYIMYSALNLMNTHIGLILLYTMFNLSFAVWMMKGFIDEIPKELEEAFMVDGYSRVRAFVKIVLPQALTGIAATAVFCLITAWNEFMFAYILAGRGAVTVPVILSRVRGESGINWGLITASEMIYLAPVIAFTFLMQRYLLRGITFGTIKG